MIKVQITSCPLLISHPTHRLQITLSYVQVTVLLASLEVGWAFPLIVMAEAAGVIDRASATFSPSLSLQST